MCIGYVAYRYDVARKEMAIWFGADPGIVGMPYHPTSSPGARFSKNLTTSLQKNLWKVWLTKNL